MTNRSDDDIREEVNLADDQMESGTKYPGMSYEEGVIGGVRWRSER